MRRFLAFLFLVALLPSSARAQADGAGETPAAPAVFTLRFAPPAVPLPLIQASVNGSEPLWFVLDTGADPFLVVTPETAKRLKLTATGRKSRVNTSVGGEVYEVGAFRLPKKSGGFVPLSGKLTAFVTPLPFIESISGAVKIAGVIGMPLLEKRVAVFDWAAQTLAVYGPDAAPPLPSNSVTLPLTRATNNLPRRHAVFRPFAGGPAFPFLVDTGAMTSSLPIPAAPLFTPRAARTIGSTQLGASYISVRLLVPQVDIGAFAEPNCPADLLQEKYGLLGMDWLARFRVTLDLQGDRIILERAADYPARLATDGETGIRLRQEGSETFVSEVLPGTPAARAALRPGDKIRAVDTQPIAGYPQMTVQYLLDGTAGTMASVRIERGGETYNVQMKRIGEFEAAGGRAYFGWVLRKGDGETVRVVHTLAGSSAAQAGLKPGDEIIRINNTPVQDRSLRDLSAALLQPTVSVIYRRGGRDIQTSLEPGTPPGAAK